MFFVKRNNAHEQKKGDEENDHDQTWKHDL